MKAWLFDPDAPRGLRLGDTAEPAPRPDQVVVAARAVSLNFGEVAYIAKMRERGEVPGWDAAGQVVTAAADGSGPPVGARVVTFGWSGAWAERRAVDVGELAVVPEGVELGVASALPVAGVTALRALRALGPILGKRVLVTGASGGVGRFAVQLAARAGARVVAAVGDVARGAGLGELGAHDIVVGGAAIPSVDGAIDTVGGPMLATAFAAVSAGGTLASVGNASQQPSTLDFEAERHRGGDRRVLVFTVGPRFGPDLAYLVELVRAGQLDPQIGWRGSWDRLPEAGDAVLARRVRGKAVVELGGAS